MQYLIALTILLAPAYALRFTLHGLPTNVLMLWVVFVWIIFSIWLITKKQVHTFLESLKKIDAKILILTSLFFLAGLISLFWRGFSSEKLGQFIILFLQPLSIFFITSFELHRNPHSKNFIPYTLYFILAAMGIYSVLQYFTLLGLPPAYWGNAVEPKRALGFFTHPNFYSLFTAPLLALLIPDVSQSLKSKIINLKSASWILGTAGLGLSLSRAGWLGLLVAGLVYLFFAADKTIKKIAGIIFILIIIIVLSIPNLRWRLTLPFYGEKSAVSRLSLWTTGWKGIKESPVLGLGLTGFSQNWNRLNTDPNLDTHNYPHNIFLNFWLETGIIGLISVIGLIGTLIYRGLKHRNNIFSLGLALFLIAIVFQGLIDNPYFKNDLAMLFWIILSFSASYERPYQKTK